MSRLTGLANAKASARLRASSLFKLCIRSGRPTHRLSLSSPIVNHSPRFFPKWNPFRHAHRPKHEACGYSRDGELNLGCTVCYVCYVCCVCCVVLCCVVLSSESKRLGYAKGNATTLPDAVHHARSSLSLYSPALAVSRITSCLLTTRETGADQTRQRESLRHIGLCYARRAMACLGVSNRLNSFRLF